MKILATDFKPNIPESEYLGVGGPASFARKMTRALTESGHQYVGVIVSSHESRLRIETAYGDKKRKFIRLNSPHKNLEKITRAKSRRDPRKILDDVIALYQKLLAEEQPDVVLLNGFDPYPWCLMRAASSLCIPIVVIHAGIWHKEIDIYKDLYTTAGRWMMKSMEKDIARYATKQVFLNEFSQNVFQREVARSPKNKRLIIPLPVSLTTVRKSQTVGKTIHIGMVARWDRIKNHRAVLDLAQTLREKGVPSKLHVITRIPETPTQSGMKKRYKQLVHVVPPTNAKGVLAFFRKMNIAILPSHFDVSPTVVLEAASQGIGTLISSDVGWVSDYRTTGNADWIVDFDDVDSVVIKIRRLAGRPLSNALIRHWKRAHDPKNVFEAYLELFESLKR